MTCACNRIGSLFLEGIMKVHRILLLAALLVGVALVSTVSAQSFSTYTNSDGSIFTQGTSLEGTVFLPGNTVNLPGYTTLPTATVSYGLSAVKVDPFLTPQYSNAVNNVWGSTNTANFAVAPNIPSTTYPSMGNSQFSSNGTGDDNAPNANNWTTWNNNNSYIYTGMVDIPQTNDPNGNISFIKQLDDSESLYIDGQNIFSDTSWSDALVTTLSQTANSYLSPGWHKIEIVTYNGGGGAGPNNGWNMGFGWDLNGDYSTTGLTAGVSVQQTIASPPTGSVGATLNLSGVTNSGFVMPIDPGDGSVFQSTLTNSFSNSLSLTGDATLDVTNSGATNIFTGGLSIGDNTLHIVGGATVPGTVQINGPVSLTGNNQSTFDVQNSNTLALYGVVSGNAGLEKIGTGKLILGNYNTYTGNTIVNAGILQLNMGGYPVVLAAGTTVTVNNGGTLLLNHGDALSWGGDAASVVINSGGTVTSGAGFRITLWNPVNMTGGYLAANGSGGNDGGFNSNYSLCGPLNATSDTAGNPATITPRLACKRKAGIPATLSST